MARAIDVARYFINKSNNTVNEDKVESITNLKLQKLLYYAQGFHLALNNGASLFPEEIQAWVHGPVVPIIYHNYKSYSYNNIDETYPSNDIDLTNEEILLLEDIWSIFKEFSGKELERLTHNETPWINARDGLSEFTYSTQSISLEILRNYISSEYIIE